MNKDNSNQYGFYGRLKAEFPSQVIVDCTEICNLECIHCPHPTFKKSAHYQGKQLDLALNAKMADEVARYGKNITQYIRYTASGEPLLYSKIYEMLDYSVKNSGTFVTLTTNGSIMDEKRIEKLLDTQLHLIDISVDAFHDETYAKIRVKGDLKIVRGNIQNLIRLRDQLTRKTKVVVSYIEQPQNAHETAEFEAFWKGEGADNVVIRKLHTASGALASAGVHAQALDDSSRRPCLYPWERIALNPAGWLSFCPSDWIHGSVVIDYRETTIHETWQSEFYKKLRKAHLCNDYKKHSFCGQCPDWKLTQWPGQGRGYSSMIEDFQNESQKK